MDLVIDIQFYKNYENNLTPKEVAIVSLEGDFVAYWVVGSTDSQNSLRTLPSWNY